MTSPAEVAEIFRNNIGQQPPTHWAERIAFLIWYWRECLPLELLAAWYTAMYPERYPMPAQATPCCRFILVPNPPNRRSVWWLPYTPYLSALIRGATPDPENLSNIELLKILCPLLGKIRGGEGPEVDNANRTMYNHGLWKQEPDKKFNLKFERQHLTVYMPQKEGK